MNIAELRKIGLLIATNNLHKKIEFENLLKPFSIPIYSLDDLHINVVVEETGTSFYENATIKAKEYFKLSKIPTLADDSGLEVDALNKEPGVKSARYGNIKFTDQERNEYLLEKMKNVADYLRTARFICVLAFMISEHTPIRYYQGVVEGKILRVPRGNFGFGYDPIFEDIKTKKSFAEYTIEEKNQISHRAKAIQEFIRDLQRLF